MFLKGCEHPLATLKGRFILRQWSSDALSDANLNQAFAPDAIVISGVTASGATYPQISDALAAGHKNIYVTDGSYTAFTVSTEGTRIVGDGSLKVSGSTIAGGPRLSGDITISANHVQILGLGLIGTTYGITAAATRQDLLIQGCIFATAGIPGISLVGGHDIRIIRNSFIDGTDGISISPLAAGTDVDGVEIHGNFMHDLSGFGILLDHYAATDSIRTRICTVTNNTIYQCASTSGDAIRVSERMGAVISNNQLKTNGSATNAADGIRINASASTPLLGCTVIGNWIYNNYGSGISRAVDNANSPLYGNICLQNQVANFVNCANAPGYATNNLNISLT